MVIIYMPMSRHLTTTLFFRFSGGAGQRRSKVVVEHGVTFGAFVLSTIPILDLLLGLRHNGCCTAINDEKCHAAASSPALSTRTHTRTYTPTHTTSKVPIFCVERTIIAQHSIKGEREEVMNDGKKNESTEKR